MTAARIQTNDKLEFDTIPAVVLEDTKQRLVYLSHAAGPHHPNYQATAARYRAKGWRVSTTFPQARPKLTPTDAAA